MSGRVLISRRPFDPESHSHEWNARGEWPARWISVIGENDRPLVAAYRLVINFPKELTVRLHVTADERYRLFLNGELVGSGSERGDVSHWFFESYDLTFRPGENVLVAQVWSLFADSPFAQMSLGHAFVLCPEDPLLVERLATGWAPWQAKSLPGFRFINPQCAWGTGFNLLVEGSSFAWGFESGSGVGWEEPNTLERAVYKEGANDKSPRRLLTPAVLPPMYSHHWSKARVRHVSFPAPGPTNTVPFRPEEHLVDEAMDWTRLVIGNPLTIPSNSLRRVILDLRDYVCAFPEISVSGGKGSSIRINWQESLFESYGSPEKGNRDEIDNKFFCTIYGWEEGVGDTFHPDGGQDRFFTTLWWQAGRFVEILIQTQNEPLTLNSLEFREDRYPFENELEFSTSNDHLEMTGALAHRTLQMCSHETYMDCPFYEQLQYIGDTRIQVLVSYVTSSDDRLAKKALQMFDWSRQIDGITQSRYPCRVTQIIPPFALWWVCMIGDFATWRDDQAFVRTLMPGARLVLDWFRETIGQLGLVEAPTGWNFVDWVPGWRAGMPLGADDGVSSIVNRQFELALRTMARLETWLSEPELAARNVRTADQIATAIHRIFWNNKRALYADDLAQTSYSEHAQVLSLLTDCLPSKIEQMVVKGLIADRDLQRTTVYFSHYLFEAYAKIGRTDLIISRMDLWFSQLKLGLKTIVEQPEPTRSDCHAWGAHPLYHFVASFAGVKPEGYGSKNVKIRPNLAELGQLSISFPFADDRASVRILDGDLEVKVPNGYTAEIVWNNQAMRITG